MGKEGDSRGKALGVGREGRGEGGWRGDWEVEPRVSPPDLGGTLLKSFPLLLSSLHGRGQERKGQGRGCEKLGYSSGEVRTERN